MFIKTEENLYFWTSSSTVMLQLTCLMNDFPLPSPLTNKTENNKCFCLLSQNKYIEQVKYRQVLKTQHTLLLVHCQPLTNRRAVQSTLNCFPIGQWLAVDQKEGVLCPEDLAIFNLLNILVLRQ